MDSDQLPCLDMDTDLYKAVMTDDMRYFHNNTHVLQSIPSRATSQEQNALHIAANFKCIDLARYLVALFPVLLTRADFRGHTALHIASKRGCSDMVACFLESEVAEQALEMKNEMDDTALHVAVRNGHLEVVTLLVQKNSMLLDLVNNHKESPLYLAVERGFSEIAEFMLEGYSSVCSCERTKGMTALHAVVIHTHKELSRENLRWPASDFFLRGYFRGKRFKDEIDIMKLLLEKKKDVIRQADELGWSPLHYAAHLGHHEAAKKLLAVDGYIAGLCDVEQSCALHIAAKNGHSNVIKEILACRPDVYNMVGYKRRTILHIAAQFGKAGVVKYILKQPDFESLINEPDKEGNTALHLAAIHGHYWVVNTLAADNRVDKRAMNNAYLKTIDILHSNMDDGRIIKYWVMKKLEHTGCVRSFRHCATREPTNLQNGGNEGYQENANTQNNINGLTTASNTSTQSSHGVSHTASHMSTVLGARNREVMKENELLSYRLNGICETHLLVAALIATVTFAAGISPPGGFREEDLHQGEAVFSAEMAFKVFFISDGVAFYFSTAAVFLHFYASIQQNYHLRLRSVKVPAILIFLSFVGMTTAFSFSIFLVVPNISGLSCLTFVLACFFLTSSIFGIL